MIYFFIGRLTNNCFKEKELDQKSVVRESLTTAWDGKTCKTKNYNPDDKEFMIKLVINLIRS